MVLQDYFVNKCVQVKRILHSTLLCIDFCPSSVPFLFIVQIASQLPSSREISVSHQHSLQVSVIIFPPWLSVRASAESFVSSWCLFALTGLQLVAGFLAQHVYPSVFFPDIALRLN